MPGGERGPDGGGPGDAGLALRIALLVGLAGAAYVGVRFALGYWRSWLLAGSVIALAIALYYLIWPSSDEQ